MRLSLLAYLINVAVGFRFSFGSHRLGTACAFIYKHQRYNPEARPLPCEVHRCRAEL